MDNIRIYQICHNLIVYFETLISPKKSQLNPIFKTGGVVLRKNVCFLEWILRNLISQIRTCFEKNKWMVQKLLYHTVRAATYFEAYNKIILSLILNIRSSWLFWKILKK